MRIKDVKLEIMEGMSFHESIICIDGEITKVYGGWIYTFTKRAENGRLVYLSPVFVKF